MNRNRLNKYQKILTFKEKQREAIKQQIGVQQNVVAQFRQQLKLHQQAMDQLELQFESQIQSMTGELALLQQYDLAMLKFQQQISHAKIELAAETEKLKQLLATYRLADQQVKSWEKLVERESAAIEAHRRNVEMLTADERYLATHGTPHNQIGLTNTTAHLHTEMRQHDLRETQ